MSLQANTTRTILYALGANGAIGAAKLGAALHTGSNAMFAEAIHSFADCGNQALLLLGSHRAKRAPSPDYPLGHGKAIFLWSFIVALILFSMGGLFSIYEGWHKLKGGHELQAPWVALAVLAFSIVMELYSLRACLQEVAKARRDKSLWRWFRQTRQSELIVVLGEDIAALVGLVFATIAVIATLVTGDPAYDALGSIAIGVLLVTVAIGVGIEVVGLLIGQSIEPETREAIQGFLSTHPEIDTVLNMITLQLGNEVMLAVKVRMSPRASAQELIAGINRCERDVRAAFPQIRWMFFEPDDAD